MMIKIFLEMRIHDVCKKRYIYSASLSYHQRSHTGEKPYECEICKKRYTSNSGLNYHQKTHI